MGPSWPAATLHSLLTAPHKARSPLHTLYSGTPLLAAGQVVLRQSLLCKVQLWHHLQTPFTESSVFIRQLYKGVMCKLEGILRQFCYTYCPGAVDGNALAHSIALAPTVLTSQSLSSTLGADQLASALVLVMQVHWSG